MKLLIFRTLGGMKSSQNRMKKIGMDRVRLFIWLERGEEKGFNTVKNLLLIVIQSDTNPTASTNYLRSKWLTDHHTISTTVVWPLLTGWPTSPVVND